MPHYKSDPRRINARYNSTCAETGKPIRKGEECIYYPRHKKVYHIDSKQAQAFREWEFDIQMLGHNY